MSQLNSVNSVPQNVQLGSEDLPIAAEWVTTGDNEEEFQSLTGLRRLLPPTVEEITGEELQATDAIAFNFLQIPPNSSSKPSVEEEDPAPSGKLSPALMGGLACLVLANGLLLWHLGTRLVNPPLSVTATNLPSIPPPSLIPTAATTSPKLSLANLSELPPPAPSPKNLPGHPAIASLNSVNSVKPTAKPLPAHPAIAGLTPPNVPAYQAIEALDPSTPRMRNALSDLLLPPSLQPQMVYSNALPPGSPYPQGTAPTLPAIAVRPPQPLSPTPSYPAATLQPQGTVSLPTRILPPPPPVSVNSLPAAPLVTPATVPAMASAPMAPPSNPSTMTPGQTNGYTTDQMLRQTLNQQNQMEIEAYQQANTPFNQKVKQKLQPLMPQIQSIQQGDTPPPGDTQGLVEQLQRLNQAE